MEITAEILQAAQEIAIEGASKARLSRDEMEIARELTEMLFCPGCG